MDVFQSLTAQELDQLIEAPLLIAVLIGAADGVLDQEESTWSEKLVHARTYSKPKEGLNDLYEKVSNDFYLKLPALLATLPKETAERNKVLSDRLALINPVLAKLDHKTGARLYKGFLALAEETAKASGGFLRFGAISKQEQAWVDLPMLTPIS